MDGLYPPMVGCREGLTIKQAISYLNNPNERCNQEIGLNSCRGTLEIEIEIDIDIDNRSARENNERRGYPLQYLIFPSIPKDDPMRNRQSESIETTIYSTNQYKELDIDISNHILLSLSYHSDY